jgi:hypothetical protein
MLLDGVGILTKHVQNLHHTIAKTIPIYVDERLYATGVTSLSLSPQSNNLEIITSIFATCTSNATITLNDRTIAITTGNFSLTNVGFLLRSNDTRIITQASAGVLSLELMGYELLDKGMP